MTDGNGSGAGGEPGAVEARHAASLILVRHGAGGPEVLMGVRGAGHRFMPNRLVFPGGGVEAGDATAPASAEPLAETIALLGRNADPALARALTMAAARELEEETGLSYGAPPRLDRLRYLCRAVTPPTQPIRFNARFFVDEGAQVAGELAGSGELEELRWHVVENVLGLDLALVTREVLRQLLGWLDLPAAARDARTATPVFSLKTWSAE